MLVLGVGACTTDFFLEAGTETDADSASTGEPPTTSAAESTSITGASAEGTTSSSSGDPTIDPPTTSGAESDGTETTPDTESTSTTTEGETTTSATGDPTTAEEASAEAASAEEASAEAGAETGGGEGGVLDCPQVRGAQEGCEASPACDWYGDGGPCFADACHPDIEIVCNDFGFEVCGEMPLCMWFGEPEMGECGLVPCNELENEACLGAPHCEWIAEEPGTCVAAECPGCWELGELDCMENVACTWLDLQESCVPD